MNKTELEKCGVSEFLGIILAGGKSKRFKSAKSKVLHPLLGKPVMEYALKALRDANLKEITVVVGGKSTDEIIETFGNNVCIIDQVVPLGTGDAVKKVMERMENKSPQNILVVPGDAPLLSAETIKKLLFLHQKEDAKCTMLTAEIDNPTGYGRIIRDGERIVRIIEDADAGPEDKEIKEVNAGVYVFEREVLKNALNKIKPDNKKGEYYLTDCIKILREDNIVIYSIKTEDPYEMLGINTREDYSMAQEILRTRKIQELLNRGVGIVQPQTLYVETEVEVGEDTILYPFVSLIGKTKIESNCEIGPFVLLEDTYVRKGNKVRGPISHISKTI